MGKSNQSKNPNFHCLRSFLCFLNNPKRKKQNRKNKPSQNHKWKKHRKNNRLPKNRHKLRVLSKKLQMPRRKKRNPKNQRRKSLSRSKRRLNKNLQHLIKPLVRPDIYSFADSYLKITSLIIKFVQMKGFLKIFDSELDHLLDIENYIDCRLSPDRLLRELKSSS